MVESAWNPTQGTGFRTVHYSFYMRYSIQRGRLGFGTPLAIGIGKEALPTRQTIETTRLREGPNENCW